MRNRYSFKDISKLKNKSVFFDANIILYTFWPTGSQHWEQQYSKIFKDILNNNINKSLNFIVISEVINRAIRTEYEKYLQIKSKQKSSFSFKKFRDSKEGQSALTDIYNIINNKVLKNFEIIDKYYNNDEIKKFLVTDNLDFSDKAIVSLCDENNYILLTNDTDFKNSNIDILTSHPKILKA
jgi:predicted nucleic acid-binding protein